MAKGNQNPKSRRLTSASVTSKSSRSVRDKAPGDPTYPPKTYAETDETTELQDLLAETQKQLQEQIARAKSLETENIQLKTRLDEGTKLLDPPQIVVEGCDPQGGGWKVVGKHGEIREPFGNSDADIADRIRLRNFLDIAQAYFAFKSNLHMPEGLLHVPFPIAHLSQLWRKELDRVDYKNVNARVQRAKDLMGDLDPTIVNDLVAMKIICSPASESVYRKRGDETHNPFSYEAYEASIRRYSYHPGDTKEPEQALLAILSLPEFLGSHLYAEAHQSGTVGRRRGTSFRSGLFSHKNRFPLATPCSVQAALPTRLASQTLSPLTATHVI